jgi:hypothetical protein
MKKCALLIEAIELQVFHTAHRTHEQARTGGNRFLPLVSHQAHQVRSVIRGMSPCAWHFKPTGVSDMIVVEPGVWV